MSLFPLKSMLSRPLAFGCHGVPKTRPTSLSPSSGRFFVPSSNKGLVRYQHMDTARMLQLRKEMKSEMKGGWSKFFIKFGLVSVGLGVSFLAAPILYCDPVTSKTASAAAIPPPSQGQAAPVQPPPPPPPTSSVKFYELTFGTVCGICAGVFVKKGARIVAFALGGVFVLLQYLGSLSLVRVDWGRAATRFENLFYTTDATGAKRPPNVGALFRWIVDFLTADFQQRASFVAGFALGLRIG
ncbi:FUN14 family-domain-containing protein [Cubamyces lactineus]|nr:FUN14 family-domain-containing protein [Cubamyces lactineus]